MSALDPNALLAGQRAAMVADGCGYTVNGEHVLCDDPRVQDDHRQTECSCKRNATAAITAYLSTVSPLSDGDGRVKALEAELLAAREALSAEDAARHLTEVAQALWDRVEARRDKSNEAVTPAEQDDAAMAYGFDKAAESIRAMIAARALSGNRSGK